MVTSSSVPLMMFLAVTATLSIVECSRNETYRAIVGHLTDIKSYPWLCSVIVSGNFVSACTIIQPTWVVLSADNLNRKFPNSEKYFFQYQFDMRVVSGSVRRIQKEAIASQVKTVLRIYLGNLTNVLNPNDFSYALNPQSLTNIAYDGYGIAMGVSLLELGSPLKWSIYVSPAPFINMKTAENMESKIRTFREHLEEKPLDQTPCVVVSFSKFTNSMVETEVAYVPIQACKEAYCIHDPANCLVYPKAEYLMCFKSLQFVDLCPSDRGAAVYCENFDSNKSKQVVAILTTAINCGAKNLPCVYTSVEMVARFFKRVARRDLEPGP
ncbi:hypothetical protein GE061_015215 [Apolygus lucorum]|uniref:Peptidase S1 domain-containing protein n=1 Tax=Apolygus lucorum TaxID=248454 RepID=A0A8S9XMJ4_APOLU|nr:hypothetical protein GE061_015215 [Apolygus lucorum]